MKQVEKINLIKMDDSQHYGTEDIVIKEAAYTLFVNNEEVVTQLCSPSNIEELATGFLCAEGFLSRRDDLLGLTVNHQDGLIWAETSSPRPTGFLQRSITSCCGRGRASFYFRNDTDNIGPVQGEIKVSAEQLRSLGHKMEASGELFRTTGGTHGAALCLPGNIICFFEDVGRHNAVDKIFGYCLLNDIARHDKLLVFTGRVSSEILLKVARMNIPLLASRSAPTHLALQLARELKVTVVGFMRKGRMNIYTYPERVV
ncbi:MAG: formate dehydrogenase accessory sulfurtransferase FdhD [Firmicutes bacterium]|nr:formate dehydrogenase accessory sulfurtransferase FdhD [Bacillota bacterium]